MHTCQRREDRRYSKDFRLLHQPPFIWQLLCFQGCGLRFSPDPGRIYSASPFQTGKLSTSLSRKALYPFTNAEYEISLRLLRGRRWIIWLWKESKGVPRVSQMRLISSVKGTRKQKREKCSAFCPGWFSFCFSLSFEKLPWIWNDFRLSDVGLH